MRTYQEIVEEYRKRQHDTVVDTLATSLTYVDELVVETGLLEDTGIMTELTSTLCGALPFVLIAVTEGGRVILGRKPAKTGVQDSAFRMVKTTAALGVGSAVLTGAGLLAAIPVTMGVRALFDRYKSKSLTGMRVRSRTNRLHELNEHIRSRSGEETEQVYLPVEALPADAVVE